jgi:putative tryptophan/tyrosine transport system substrate-binding protein
MRRREFIAGLGGAAVWPMAARAQQPAMPVVGFLSGTAPSAQLVAALRQGLNEVGFVEGRNVVIEFRWADGRNDRLPALAADLVGRQVAVIVGAGAPAALAAKTATTTIPTVFIVGVDPVAVGLSASLSRPGGNLTGVTVLSVELAPKRLQILHELLPTTTSVALLVNPTSGALAETLSREVEAAAGKLGLHLHLLDASTERDFDTVFASLSLLHAGGLVIGSDPFFGSRSAQLAALAVRHAVATIYEYREFAAAGGLTGYGASLLDAFRLAGAYTGRILKGEKPADLPVQQSTKIELFINLKTAKALGLTIPETLLATADEVIQ